MLINWSNFGAFIYFGGRIDIVPISKFLGRKTAQYFLEVFCFLWQRVRLARSFRIEYVLDALHINGARPIFAND